MTEETVKIVCKYCGSADVVKAGFQAGTQRYLCHKCHRKFKADDMPFHMKVPSSNISSALSMYYTGSSITDIRNHLRQETGYYPSKSRVFYWIEKYTEQAANHFSKAKPKVGDTWIADETMIDLDKGVKVWFWDIIDADTRFLLASRVSLTRTTQDAKRLVQNAVKRAGKPPKMIITDKMKSYPDGIFTALGGYTEHLQGSPFKIASESTSRIERFHETLKERTKVMKAFRDIETLITFASGFLAYYNFLKPHEALKGKTPAEKAKIRYKAKTWVDVVNMPVPVEVERARRISPRMKLEQPKVSIKGAFKRKRPKPHQKHLPMCKGVYTDRKGERLTRKHRKGWRRIY
ncbi:MAG TPA: DDE-type integrase/transposase/recombinase [Dehalococcoidia bacterium]|nr:DDE-type integrase/transposase/recombinase [Dehalococcoidia bacterium]